MVVAVLGPAGELRLEIVHDRCDLVAGIGGQASLRVRLLGDGSMRVELADPPRRSVKVLWPRPSVGVLP